MIRFATDAALELVGAISREREMGMSIDESGSHGQPRRVDDARVPAGELANLRRAVHGDETTLANGKRLSLHP